MATICIFSPPGGGKTTNSTLTPGKKLLLSSDASAVVLRNFERENLTIKNVATFKEFVDIFEAATDKKEYDVIIVDCLTDIIDAFIVECRESGQYKDVRPAYLAVYTKVKALVRKAAHCSTHVIFNCWEDMDEMTFPDGSVGVRLSPMLPSKIKQQVLGLCQIVARVATAKDREGNQRWYYITDPNDKLLVKDQIGLRKAILPEKLLEGLENA